MGTGDRRCFSAAGYQQTHVGFMYLPWDRTPPTILRNSVDGNCWNSHGLVYPNGGTHQRLCGQRLPHHNTIEKQSRKVTNFRFGRTGQQRERATLPFYLDASIEKERAGSPPKNTEGHVMQNHTQLSWATPKL